MNSKCIISLFILTTLVSSNANLIDYLKNAFKGSPDEVRLEARQDPTTTVASSTVRKCPLGIPCTAAEAVCSYANASIACDDSTFCCLDRDSLVTCCTPKVRPTDPVTTAPGSTTTAATTTTATTPTTTATTPTTPSTTTTLATTTNPDTPTTTLSTTPSTVKCG